MSLSTEALGNIAHSFGQTLLFQGFVGAALLCLFGILILRATSSKRDPNARLPPVYKTGLPIIGNFIAFAKSPLGILYDAQKKLGNVFTIPLAVEDCTFLIGPEAHATFFGASDEELDQGPVYQFMTPIFGKGIIYDTNLYKRRQQMRALGGILKPAMLRKYSNIIAKETHAYLRKTWGKEGQIDLLPSMAELIILTASATLLGPEVRGELFCEVSHLYEMLDKGLTPLSIFLPYAPIPAHAKRDKARKEMVKLFSGVIKNRRDNPEEASKNIDILQKLIEFNYKDGTKLTDDEVTGMLIAALFAGQHTSNITTTWTALFLLEDKRNHGGVHYENVIQELAALEASPGEFARGEGITSTVLSQEKNMYGAVKESIRMHPPLIMLMRRVMKDLTTVDGITIPKGHRVMVSNAVAQRSADVFDDPDTWNPARWTNFDITKLPKYSFIGFGAGLHTCMGEPFAFMQIRTILTVLFSMYEMELTTPFPEANYEAMVVPPKGPNMVKYKLRGKPISSLAVKKDTEKNAFVPEPIVIVDAPEGEDNEFTLEEIAKHNRKGDLWIIVKDRVFDVSNYLDVHQGGDNAILKWGGADATDAVAGPQHPTTVPTLLERYCIGKVKK